MGPWASVVVAIGAVAGVFFAVMGFRGLIDTVQQFSGQCAGCGRTTLLPLPLQSHECRRCHHVDLGLGRLMLRRPHLHR